MKTEGIRSGADGRQFTPAIRHAGILNDCIELTATRKTHVPLQKVQLTAAKMYPWNPLEPPASHANVSTPQPDWGLGFRTALRGHPARVEISKWFRN